MIFIVSFNMAGVLNRMFGVSDVQEKNGKIIISGVSAQKLSSDIKKIWNTTKIANNLFTKVSWGQIEIPSFYAIELKFILEKMLETNTLLSNRKLLRNVVDGINQNTWVRGTLSEPKSWFNWSGLDIMSYKPLPHQLQFLQSYESVKVKYNLKGYLLAAAPGAGKTAISIWVSSLVNATKVIIVSPKAAIYNVWNKTLQVETRTPLNPWIAERDGRIDPSKKYHIFHYESLDAAVELAKIFGISGEKTCVILDESHNLTDIKSLRTQRFLQVCMFSRSDDIIWASGTPIKALGAEAIPFIKSIDALFTREVEEVFRKMYGKDATRTLNILAHRIGIITHQTKKSEFMSDKPIELPVPVKIPNSDRYLLSTISKTMVAFTEERMEYYKKNRETYQKTFDRITSNYRNTLRSENDINEFNQYLRDVKYLAGKKFDNKLDAAYAMSTNAYEKSKILPTCNSADKALFTEAKSVIKYTDLKVRGECLGRILTKERIQCHLDMLEHIDFSGLLYSVEKKTIIFTSYVSVVDKLSEKLTSEGMNILKVYGNTNSELPRIVQKFGSDDLINPLIATLQSLSTAVPMTMANGIVFLNNPWRSYERDQAIARAWRIGQDKPVFVHDVFLDTGKEPNISTRSIDILQWSKDQVDRIFGVEGGVEVSLEYNGLDVQVIGDVCDLIEDVAYIPLELVGDRVANNRITQTTTISLET